MNESEATHKVRQMYARHGKEPRDPVVTELADEMLDASCHTCALNLVTRAGTEGKVPLTVPAFRAQMREATISVEHANHMGQRDRDVAVGEIEAWWRAEAPKHIRKFTAGDELLTLLVAALMWSSGMARREHLIVEDLEPIGNVWGHPWVERAQRFAEQHGGLTRDAVEAAFTEAREHARREAA